MRWRAYGYFGLNSLLVVWVGLVAALLLTFHPVASDWNIYYDTARALRLDPHARLMDYAVTTAAARQPGACPLWPDLGYLYPPLLAMLLVPFTYLPCGAATLLWRMLSLVLWAACAGVLMAAPWRLRGKGWRLVGLAGVAIYLPLIDGMLLGQAHLIILATILAGAALVQGGREEWAGGVLALGAWIKYLPIAVVGYYLLTRRWRVAVGALAGGLALLVAQVLVVGPASVLAGLEPAASAASGTDSSLWYGIPGGDVWGVAACGVFILAVVVGERTRQAERDDALGAGWAVCTVLLLAPVAHWSYLTWLLPAFWACARTLIKRRPDTAPKMAMSAKLALGALGIMYALALVPFNHATIFGAMVCLWLMCGGLYARAVGVWPRDAARLAKTAKPAAA